MKNKNVKIPLFVVLFFITTVMCGPNLDTEYFAKTRPDERELIGTYYPTDESMKLIRDDGGYELGEKDEITIWLKADGAFEMKNMPDWWNTEWGEPKGGKDAGTGEWRIVEHQEWWDVQLHFASREDFSSETMSSGMITSIPIVGNEPPYSLWFYIGDLDSGKVMVFERKSSE